MGNFLTKIRSLARKWGIPTLHTQKYPFHNNFWFQMLWPAVWGIVIVGLLSRDNMLNMAGAIIAFYVFVYVGRTYNYWLQCEFLESHLPEMVQSITHREIIRTGTENKIKLHPTLLNKNLVPQLKTHIRFKYTDPRDMRLLLSQFLETGQDTPT